MATTASDEGGRRRLVRSREGRLEFPEGGGCLSLFGMPFLGAGIFLTLAAIGIIPMSNAEDVPAWAWLVMGLMGLAFVAVGGWLVLGRQWLILEPARGVALRRRGLLVPMREEWHLLDNYDAVLLLFEEGDSDTADRYPVKLRARGGGPDLQVCSSGLWQDSREAASLTARFLGWPLIDRSTSHETTSESAHAGETLQERLRAGRGGIEPAARPAAMRAAVEESPNEARIVIPGPRFRWSVFLGFVPGLVVLYAVAPDVARFLDDSRTPPFVQHAILAVAVLFLAVLPALSALKAAIAAVRSRTVITASSAGVSIEHRGAVSSRTVRIAAGDILDLDHGTADDRAQARWRAARTRAEAMSGRQVPDRSGRPAARWVRWMERLTPSAGVQVKSRKGIFTFGAGLPDAEVRYLEAVVRRALTGVAGG